MRTAAEFLGFYVFFVALGFLAVKILDERDRLHRIDRETEVIHHGLLEVQDTLEELRSPKTAAAAAG